MTTHNKVKLTNVEELRKYLRDTSPEHYGVEAERFQPYVREIKEFMYVKDRIQRLMVKVENSILAEVSDHMDLSEMTDDSIRAGFREIFAAQYTMALHEIFFDNAFVNVGNVSTHEVQERIMSMFMVMLGSASKLEEKQSDELKADKIKDEDIKAYTLYNTDTLKLFCQFMAEGMGQLQVLFANQKNALQVVAKESFSKGNTSVN